MSKVTKDPVHTGPQGCVMVLVDKDGRTWATATDFEQGPSEAQADYQETRCSRELAREFIRQACSPIIGKLLESYQAQELLRKACQHEGFRVTTVWVGYPDAPS